MTGTPANGATEPRQVVRFDEDRHVTIEIWAFVLCAIAWPEEPEDGLAVSKRWSALVARPIAKRPSPMTIGPSSHSPCARCTSGNTARTSAAA